VTARRANPRAAGVQQMTVMDYLAPRPLHKRARDVEGAINVCWRTSQAPSA